MTAPTITPVSYSTEGAALATGYSVDVIRRAIRAGDLAVHYPHVDGRTLTKGSILRDELKRWVRDGDTERATS